MTGLKTYLALISAGHGKTKLSEPLMRTAKRMLGPEQSAVAAWPTGFITAFRSDEDAQTTTDRLVREMGIVWRVAVLELGQDIAQSSVIGDHAGWIADLKRQV